MATPANARRLLILQRFCLMEIPQDIRALAAQDTISEHVFDPLVCPHSITKQTITQFLLDCNLRAIVQPNIHPEFNRISLLNAVKLSNPEHIIIVSKRPRPWRHAVSAVSLEQATQITSTLPLDNLKPWQSVLIVDADMSTFRYRLAVYCREFPRLIIYEHVSNIALLTHWSSWAHLLFPSMPHPLYVRMRDIPPSWRQLQLVMFAPLYNTCIFRHLIDDPEVIGHIDDRSVTRTL